MSSCVTERSTGDTQRAGQYLTFTLDGESYGLEILHIREIMQVPDITPVPNTPCHIKGVVNIRGKVIPIVDLRLKFNMLEAEYTVQTCIIVVYIGHREIGLIVDRVSEVIDIADEEIEETIDFGANVDTRSILGLTKTTGKVAILLDIDEVLRDDEMDGLC